MGGLKGDGGTINLLKVLFQQILYVGGALWLALTSNNFGALDAIVFKKK